MSTAITLAVAACSSAGTATLPSETAQTNTTPQQESAFETPEATPLPPPTPTVFPTATPDDPDWEDPAVGVERRDLVVTEPRTGTSVRLHMVRLDPTLIDFRVHYKPGEADTVTGWQADTGALVVVNGGFFDAVLTKQGITLVDGEIYGTARDYEDEVGVGGLFAVKDGQVSIVPLGREASPPDSYDFDYATEAYPMLLNSGGKPAFNEETGHTAERTVVAIDESGRVIFILIREDAFTLYGLSHTLAELDELNLDVVLNLDGGTSSGMVVRAGEEDTPWYSVTALPIVIAAYPKVGSP
jgi:uncharacterized protein YigE (DUF2233 family)